MKKFLNINEAAEYLNLSRDTLRRWEKRGRIKPYRTQGNQRRYTVEMLDSALIGNNIEPETNQKLTVGYCRVSSAHQKADLKRQVETVQTFCEKRGYQFKIIKDIGSGLNYERPGLKELIHLICSKQCDRVVINYQDRLVRFGFELIKQVCEENDVEVVIINQSDDLSYYEELTQDVLSVITIFSAKLYGKRSHHNEKIVKANKEFFKEKKNS